jgi:prolyl 4-hydroxylase
MTTLRPLARSPRLYVADDFVSDRLIAHVLAAVADAERLERYGVDFKHDYTGRSCELPIIGDRRLRDLARRIERVAGTGRNELGATMRFRHYLPGEYHPPHLDCYEFEGLTLQATAFMYLSDVDAGGETRFPKALPGPVDVAPRRGRLALWFNYLPDGREDPLAEHEGVAVRAGEKLTLAYFIYRPIEEVTGRVEEVAADA